MNYSINEKLFTIKSIWKGLSASQHRAMTIVLNQIVHWTTVKGQCELREGNIERSYRIPRKDIVSVRNKLLALKYIKCIRTYDKKTQQPAVYSCTTGLWQIIPRPVVNNTKAIVPGTMVNYSNNTIIRDSESSLEEDTSSQPEEQENLNSFLETVNI